jgi:hypothetical protein
VRKRWLVITYVCVNTGRIIDFILKGIPYYGSTPSVDGGNAMDHLSMKKLKFLAFSRRELGLKNKINFDTSKWTSLFYQSIYILPYARDLLRQAWPFKQYLKNKNIKCEMRVKSMTNEIPVYDLKDLSKKLKISIRTLREYVKDGKLRAKKIGKAYFISDLNVRFEYFSRFFFLHFL